MTKRTFREGQTVITPLGIGKISRLGHKEASISYPSGRFEVYTTRRIKHLTKKQQAKLVSVKALLKTGEITDKGLSKLAKLAKNPNTRKELRRIFNL